MDGGIQGALGALHGDVVAVNFDLNAGGMTMGFLPILDIVYAPFLPHKGEHFAAHVRLRARLVGHNALRSGDDRRAKALHDLRQLLAVGVDAQAGLRHAADAGDDGRAVSVYFKVMRMTPCLSSSMT